MDQGNVNCLETVDDVHVLTGALKLFFRELKEPLIPWGIVDKLLLAANSQSRKQKVKQMKALVHCAGMKSIQQLYIQSINPKKAKKY